MNKLFFVVFAINILVISLPVFAEESNYIMLNKEQNWQITSSERLIRIINNPARYNPEEFVAALHEYSKRHGIFINAQNSLEALVNAYIAKNPSYMDWSTEEIFLWTARSRGVPSLQYFIYEFTEKPIVEETPIDEYSFYKEDYVSVILKHLQENIPSYKLLNAGLYDDGSIFMVYQVTDEINVTISIDTNGAKYLIGNVKSDEAMREVLEYLTEFYSEPIPYLKHEGYEAVFHDSDNIYINDNLDDYVGSITVYGSQMFIEEVIPQDKIIIQKQWCTKDFFEKCTIELEQGWGFIASWDNEE